MPTRKFLIFEKLSEAVQAAEMQANFQQKITPVLKNKKLELLVSQRFRRVQLRCPIRRINAEYESYGGGYAYAEHCGVNRKREQPCQAREFGKEIREPERNSSTECNSNNPAKSGQNYGFDKELREDVFIGCAKSFSEPDFARSFGHRDEHYIHYAYAADNQRYCRNGCQEKRYDARYIADRLHGLCLCFDIKIIFGRVGYIVRIAEDSLHVSYCFRNVGFGVGLYDDAVKIFSSEDISLSGRVWNQRHFVKIYES